MLATAPDPSRTLSPLKRPGRLRYLVAEPLKSLLSRLAASLVIASGIGWSSPSSAEVGFTTLTMPAPGGASIPVAVWYPTTSPESDSPLGLFVQHVARDAPVVGRGLKLIVISHGNGGTKDGHFDTAVALAKAGFVVSALEHTGDNYRDQSRATDLANRPRELHSLIDLMTSDWIGHATLDPTAVGAFGFSSGGFTVLAAAGGEPDLSLFAPHCGAHPQDYDCRLVATHGGLRTTSGPLAIAHDPRIRPLVIAAPALGFTFAHGLATVTQPVQLWRAYDDHVLPAPDYADAVAKALPRSPEFHTVAHADHYDFLAPCSAALAQAVPAICQSEAGFDRAAFHAHFDREVVAFFRRVMR